MSKEKWQQRERKLRKKRQGMRVSGRSLFTLQELQRRRAEKLRQEKVRKQDQDG